MTLLYYKYYKDIIIMTKNKKEVKEIVAPTLLNDNLLNVINDITGKTVALYNESSKILYNNVIGMKLKSLPTAKNSPDRQEIEKVKNGDEIVRIVSLLLKAKSYDMGKNFEECWNALLPTNIEGDKMALGKFRRGMRDNLDTYEEKNSVGEFTKAKKKANATAKEKARTKNKENASTIVGDRLEKFVEDQVQWCIANEVENPQQYVLNSLASFVANKIKDEDANEFPKNEKAEKKDAINS